MTFISDDFFKSEQISFLPITLRLIIHQLYKNDNVKNYLQTGNKLCVIPLNLGPASNWLVPKTNTNWHIWQAGFIKSLAWLTLSGIFLLIFLRLSRAKSTRLYTASTIRKKVKKQQHHFVLVKVNCRIGTIHEGVLLRNALQSGFITCDWLNYSQVTNVQ